MQHAVFQWAGWYVQKYEELGQSRHKALQHQAVQLRSLCPLSSLLLAACCSAGMCCHRDELSSCGLYFDSLQWAVATVQAGHRSWESLPINSRFSEINIPQKWLFHVFPLDRTVLSFEVNKALRSEARSCRSHGHTDHQNFALSGWSDQPAVPGPDSPAAASGGSFSVSFFF